jgi:hypothetical protein
MDGTHTQRKKEICEENPDFFHIVLGKSQANENDVDDGNYLNWMRYYFRYRLYYCYSDLAEGLSFSLRLCLAVMMECLE